tara:strand:- start:677 stop:1522 length:846 start_codon:yes stop_codon:yes gene_type:complete
MTNIQSLLSEAKKELINCSVISAEIDSEILLSNVLKVKRDKLIINSQKTVNFQNIKKFNSFIERRKKKEPVAYILNKKDFWKNTFFVDKNVLIPRPDTEILIEQVLKKYQKNKKISILDVGTGSGCIIISILKERENFMGCAIDISKKALNIAKYNAKIHHLENRIKFHKSSVDKFFKGKYDLIISNPPYIKKFELKYLENDIIGFEPNLALEGGNDGFLVTKQVIKGSSRLLKKGGSLIMEIGFDQKMGIKKILEKENFFVNKIIKDYGENHRCVICTKL